MTAGLRLLADDLTGALDAAAEMVALTGPVEAFWHDVIPPTLPANAALDSGTRETSADVAAGIVGGLAPKLSAAAIPFKKIDSLMRGSTIAEIAACFRAGGWAHAVLAPAFPHQGRVTRGGVQHARDHAGRWAPVGEDLVARLRAAGVAAQAGSVGAPLPAGVSVFDAETEADLAAIVSAGRAAPGPVLWIGTGGLAQALAHRAAPLPQVQLPGPILGLFGSDQPVTAAQLAACDGDWHRLRDGGPAEAAVVAAHLHRHGRVAVSLDLPAGLARADAARRIAAELHRLVHHLPPPGTLVAAGGETLRGLCLSLGATSLEVHGRILPGVPRSILRGGAWDGVTVVSKSGAFGTRGLLRDILRSARTDLERIA
ncbi:MAG TPA: four-carbon acid sugar kinase family protein [Rhodopila sp.]|uniref:four-carbon acid sugar kinase family protein n=1 Tax=Rhodopila sp. TaxID=2480087 RepID=UPI002C5C22FF|nr:four-carbon acid sugar kinase family protein [Rhodopila sp.]HVY17209.1 four-carbon acid sugar kinase family protein [Rhodopila sp.]